MAKTKKNFLKKTFLTAPAMARQNDEKKQFIVSTFINTSYNICEKEQKKKKHNTKRNV
jgi:DNA-binding helix-hairpin-helix protein with protein kinase domain